ncbi:L-type lectin-domain containing protein [Actinoplanes sp. NPDC051851]|uniref:L-type lectin-domain containing protein n=1 Tax=Actinoplanes sp. NPDC051851 TaxID=3154753 RepID=UPI00342EF5E0
MRLRRTSRVVRGGLFAAVLLTLTASGPASATPVAGTGGHHDTFAVNGTASLVREHGTGRKVIELTNGGFKQTGSAWRVEPIAIDRSFETSFTAYLHHGRRGADGIAFLAQGSGIRALGGWGGGLGYRGIRRSVAIEFDTYQNTTDPDSNHLAVVLGGDPDRHRTVVRSSIPLFGRPWRARIRYDAANEDLRVYVRAMNAGARERLMLEERISLADEIELNDGWIGFTGATGDYSASQDVYDWTVRTPR